MERILLLDPSVATDNLGDEIIMECVRKELEPLLEGNFVRTIPTHVASFHWYQILRNSWFVHSFRDSKYKFVGGSNLLTPNLFRPCPQWSVNIFDYHPFKDCILVGVGARNGAENGSNWYTRYVYQHLLNNTYFHSARDGRSKKYIESLGLKAINTGCVTMWMFTPDFCKEIPSTKSEQVVFTLKSRYKKDERDQSLINILLRNYKKVVFWPQGICDFDYFHSFENIENITVLSPTKDAYDNFLTQNETDYVGIRLHGGIYAMRHKRRAIIIAIDERARAINEKNHLNCVDLNQMEELEGKINSEFSTEVVMDFEAINRWKQQFGI